MTILDKIIVYKRSKIEDSRGWFLKVVTGQELNLPNRTGEIYLTMALPGEVKGGHYHPLANEWFTLIAGECTLKITDVYTKESYELYLGANNPITVYVPAGIAHAFINISKKENFILLAYSDQYYDPSDTISYLL